MRGRALLLLFLTTLAKNSFANQTFITFSEFAPAPSNNELVIDDQYRPVGVLFRAGVLVGTASDIPNCKTIPMYLDSQYLFPSPPGLRCRPIFDGEIFPDATIIIRFVDPEFPYDKIYARNVSFDLSIAVGSGASITTYTPTGAFMDSVSLASGGLQRVALSGIMHEIRISVPDGNSKFAIDSLGFELFKLIIEQPKKDEVFRLTNNNYRETYVTYKTNIMDRRVEFTNKLEYAASGGRGQTALTEKFSGHPTDPIKRTYASQGGKSTVNASLADGGANAVARPVTFFIVGSPIPDSDITARLVNLYNGATPNLMTGIASRESSYMQFKTSTLYGLSERWPNESYDGGSHIGLMMVETAPVMAWDWLENTQAGVRLFVREKLPAAGRNERRIRNGVANEGIYGHPGLRRLTDVELENMALVLYGPFAPIGSLAEKMTQQYYSPACIGGTVVLQRSDLLCQGGQWEWFVNIAGNPDGVAYADSVRAQAK